VALKDDANTGKCSSSFLMPGASSRLIMTNATAASDESNDRIDNQR
jgi:hypothetical protein